MKKKNQGSIKAILLYFLKILCILYKVFFFYKIVIIYKHKDIKKIKKIQIYY